MMKNSLVVLLCLGMVALFAACNPKEDPASVAVDKNSVTLPAAGGSEEIIVETNRPAWSADRPAGDDWCTLKQDGNKLTISAAAYEGGSPKRTTVTVKAGEGGDTDTKTIKVSQAAAAPFLTINPKEAVTLDSEGRMQTVEIATNNADWLFRTENGEGWCKLQKKENTLQITADPNTGVEKSVTVIISSGAGDRFVSGSIKVTQLAAAPYLAITPDGAVALDENGTRQTVQIATNNAVWSFKTASGGDWCKLKKSGDTALEISADANLGAERSTEVIVSSGEGARLITKSFTVIQAKAPKKMYEITLPTDFSTGYVQKALYGGAKIAEICLEYIKNANTDEQMAVVYPVIDGVTDLAKGIAVKNGGSIVWDVTANTCTYTAGTLTSPLTKIYFSEGELSLAPDGNVTAAAVEAELLVDNRPGQSETYKIVKIGTQYWMAENLRAEKYRDGTAIPNVSDGKEWNANTTGAYRYLYDNPKDHKALFGALYNGYAMFNEAGLAPDGWIVPSDTEWGKMRSYIKTPYAAKLRGEEYWTASDKVTPNNKTGFTAMPGGCYSSGTGDAGDGNETWWWSTTLKEDWLTKVKSPVYYRIVYNNTVMQTDTHSYNFGHSVRCVRK